MFLYNNDEIINLDNVNEVCRDNDSYSINFYFADGKYACIEFEDDKTFNDAWEKVVNWVSLNWIQLTSTRF